VFCIIQDGARKTGLPSRRSPWAQVSDSVQEIKQMQMPSTYWLEKVQKMISLYVSALLCTLQHTVCHTRDATQRCQFGELTSLTSLTSLLVEAPHFCNFDTSRKWALITLLRLIFP